MLRKRLPSVLAALKIDARVLQVQAEVVVGVEYEELCDFIEDEVLALVHLPHLIAHLL